jgi:hypothetical protein
MPAEIPGLEVLVSFAISVSFLSRPFQLAGLCTRQTAPDGETGTRAEGEGPAKLEPL